MHIHLLATLCIPGLVLSAQAKPEFSLEREATLGRQLAAEHNRQNAPIDSPLVQEYLDQLGDRLASPMTEARSPFRFTAFAGETCRFPQEPTALPGGYVFVSSALFLAAQDESEFAAVLAHSMEHIAQRHGVYDASRGRTATNTVIPLIFINGWTGTCGVGSAIPSGFLEARKRNEIEADTLAVEALAHAGLDPRGLVAFVQRLPAPDRDPRLISLLRAVGTLPRGVLEVSRSDDFFTAQKEVRRLTEPPVRPKLRPTLMR